MQSIRRSLVALLLLTSSIYSGEKLESKFECEKRVIEEVNAEFSFNETGFLLVLTHPDKDGLELARCLQQPTENRTWHSAEVLSEVVVDVCEAFWDGCGIHGRMIRIVGVDGSILASGYWHKGYGARVTVF